MLLALPVMLAVLPWRRMVPFLVRAALPSAVLLGATAIANWHDTYMSVTSQPDSPVINHPTAWTSLAPQMANQNVAAGPFRLATIVLACLCALAIRRRWQSRATARREWRDIRLGDAASSGDAATWSAALLTDVLWWVALTLALRSFFEPVMVSYYPWPPMAVALIPAATLSWPRLVAVGVLAGGLTAAAQGPSHAVWIWWVPIVAGLVVLLALARPTATMRTAPPLRDASRLGQGHLTTGGETGSRAGRLADRPSPEEVPCRRRLIHGAQVLLRPAGVLAAGGQPGGPGHGVGQPRSAAGPRPAGRASPRVTGTPSTSHARSATRWCDCAVRCSRSGDHAPADRRNRIDHRSTR